MTTSTRRYLVPVTNLNYETTAIKTALAKAYELALEAPVKEVLLITPTNHQLAWGTTLVEAIGERAAKALLTQRSLPFGQESVSLIHESERTFQNRWIQGVILAVYAGKKILDKVDDCPKAYAVVVVPGRLDQTSEWVKARSPEIVGDSTKPAPERLIDNPVVERAMEYLTDSINLNNDLVTSYDRGLAIEFLKMLRDGGEDFKPSDLRAWAIRHGWSPKGADNLRDLGQKILDRRSVRGGMPGFSGAKLLKQLREEVRNGEPCTVRVLASKGRCGGGIEMEI